MRLIRWIKSLFNKKKVIPYYDKTLLEAIKNKSIFNEFGKVKEMPKEAKGTWRYEYMLPIKKENINAK